MNDGHYFRARLSVCLYVIVNNSDRDCTIDIHVKNIKDNNEGRDSSHCPLLGGGRDPRPSVERKKLDVATVQSAVLSVQTR